MSTNFSSIFSAANGAMAALQVHVVAPSIGHLRNFVGAKEARPSHASTFVPAVAMVQTTSTTYDGNENSSYLMTEGLSPELVIAVIEYLDAKSLCQLQQTCRLWRAELERQDSALWVRLIQRDFHVALPPTAAPTVYSYITTLEAAARVELRHLRGLQQPYRALEEFCATERDHGIVGMLCDLCYFENPLVGQAIARQRFGALGMVVVQTPGHVQAFRKQSHYVGPINFVPLQNPHWPNIELPPVNAAGFLGYAFDLTKMLPGFEHLKDTVVRAIMKNIAVFSTRVEAQQFQNSQPSHVPTVALDDPGAPFELSFVSPLRTRLAPYVMTEKLSKLERLTTACNASLVAIHSHRFP
ncbi:hypothetical protein ACHHYP_09475 [Achlya hypogyna]|uniref:F-box domain-containing protein n=1 Tax=Achlya hypogyna TaxID=1202772 RepID=A0A1V9YN10_ACHHY|nr:hypothetical protein ACHHYP_09475 [Achlya hypogyna]